MGCIVWIILVWCLLRRGMWGDGNGSGWVICLRYCFI